MALSGRPLLNNPLDADLFVGRDRELLQVERFLQSQLNVLLIGPPGVGKTSFMHAVERWLHETGRLGYFVAAGAVEQVPALVDQLLDKLTKGHGVSPTAANTAGIDRLSAFVTEVSDAGQIVFLVDDLVPAVAHTFFGRYRDEVWRLPATWVVSAQSNDIGTFLLPPADAFFETRLHLDPWNRAEAAQALGHRASTLTKEQVEAIVKLTDGRPRSLVQMANAVLMQAAAAPPGADGVAWAVERLRSAWAAQEALVAHLTPSARKVWEDVSQNGPASASDEALMQRLGWSRPHVAQAFYELQRASLVIGYHGPNDTGRRPRKVYAARPLAELATT